jgi:hypothetical protein
VSRPLVPNPIPDTPAAAQPLGRFITLKFGLALTRLAASDPALHKLIAEVQHLLKPRTVYRDPELVQRVVAVMAAA